MNWRKGAWNRWLWCWYVLLWCTGMVALPESAVALPRSGVVKVVIDGDTILLDSGEKVRYLGMDAPELAHDETPADCYGEQARDANQRLVLRQRVTIEYERDTHDAHGRLLAYVLLADGRCVNAELLRSGHAFLFRPSDGLKRFAEFLACQREALAKRSGMWGACEVTSEPYYLGNPRSWIFHRPDCAVGRQVTNRNRKVFTSRWSALEEAYRPCRRCKP